MICNWIQFLRKVLPHTEDQSTWLNFILFPEAENGNGRSKKIIRSKIHANDLKFDLTGINEIMEIADKDDLHSSERKSVFRQALSELIQHFDEDKAFSHILENIQKLYSNYCDNYERYINGFSLEKLKKEVIEDYSKFSGQISSALNDIIAKAFAVPASLVAAALLIRLDTPISKGLMALAIIISTAITFLMLSWQKRNISLIKSDVETTFKKFSESDASGSDFVRRKQGDLESSIESVSWRLTILKWISWLPIIAMLVYFWFELPIIQLLVEELIESGKHYLSNTT